MSKPKVTSTSATTWRSGASTVTAASAAPPAASGEHPGLRREAAAPATGRVGRRLADLEHRPEGDAEGGGVGLGSGPGVDRGGGAGLGVGGVARVEQPLQPTGDGPGVGDPGEDLADGGRVGDLDGDGAGAVPADGPLALVGPLVGRR